MMIMMIPRQFVVDQGQMAPDIGV